MKTVCRVCFPLACAETPDRNGIPKTRQGSYVRGRVDCVNICDRTDTEQVGEAESVRENLARV